MATAVVPVPPVVAHSDLVYVFCSSRALPSFDGHKSIKNVVLPAPALQRFNRFLFRTKGWISLLYAVGFICGGFVLFVPAGPGAWFAFFALSLELPAAVAAYLVLRYDIVRLVLRTFEFWYVTLINVACIVLISYTFSDWRILMVLSSGIGYQVPFLMDAVYRGTTITIVASVMGAAADIMYILVVAFDIMDKVQHSVLVSGAMQSLSVDDVIVNGLGTVIVLLIRNAYRKYQLLALRRTAGKSTGSCIMYRCCLSLQLARGSNEVPRVEATQRRLANTPPTASTRIQLHFVGSRRTFDARATLLPQWIHRLSIAWPPCLQFALQTIGFVGLATLLSLQVSSALHDGKAPPFAAPASCVCAVVFCGTYFMHCQRQLLLQELLRSFDFMFMSVQFTLAHLSGCDVVSWDARCVEIISSWLWSHWLIMLDAVTPVMKRKLGFRSSFAALVALLLISLQAVLIVTLMSSTGSRFRDRVLFVAHLGGHEKSFRVVPFFLWRVFTTLLWCSRLLWRLVDRKGDELIVLQGQVQYEDTILLAKRQSGVQSRSRRRHQQKSNLHD